jgi:hypothetical protein
VGAFQVLADLGGSDSSAAFMPTSGWAPAPRPWVMVTPSWMRRSVLAKASCWASVLATTNSTAFEAGVDHVVDGVAAGSAHAEDDDPGFSSVV